MYADNKVLAANQLLERTASKIVAFDAPVLFVPVKGAGIVRLSPMAFPLSASHFHALFHALFHAHFHALKELEL